MYVASETFGLRCPGFSPGFDATRAGILAWVRSSRPSGSTFTAEPNAPLPHAAMPRAEHSGMGPCSSPIRGRQFRHSVLSTQHSLVSTASAPGLAPLHFRRGTARPVSCDTLFGGWLLGTDLLAVFAVPLPSTSTLGPDLRALADGLGCFPLDDGAYSPPSHSRSLGNLEFGV